MNGETLYHYSPVSTQPITGNSEVELRAKISKIFQTDVKRTYDEDFSSKGDFEIGTSLHGLPEDGILTRMINGSRRIKILYPEKMEKVVDDDRILYFNGKVDEIDVFVKRIPINRNDLKNDVERVYTKFCRLERVVRHRLTESDEKYYYCAFEKMDTDLPTYIKEKAFFDDTERLHIIRIEGDGTK
nr:glutamine-tRNA ligase, putative / glutaminyl-tRNA synthetase, putative / GlnRS [Tanacetum cinerariifolium]